MENNGAEIVELTDYCTIKSSRNLLIDSQKYFQPLSLPDQEAHQEYRHYITDPISHPFHSPNIHGNKPLQNPNCPKSDPCFSRYIHCTSGTEMNNSVGEPKLNSEESEEEEEDVTMNEFLSLFVWIMRTRGKLSQVYPDCDKQTINGMLLIIVGKVTSEMEKGGLEEMLGAAMATSSQDFSEDLWKTVWEVSNRVLDDMKKEKQKEKMKGFLQSEGACKARGVRRQLLYGHMRHV